MANLVSVSHAETRAPIPHTRSGASVRSRMKKTDSLARAPSPPRATVATGHGGTEQARSGFHAVSLWAVGVSMEGTVGLGPTGSESPALSRRCVRERAAAEVDAKTLEYVVTVEDSTAWPRPSPATRASANPLSRAPWLLPWEK